MLLGNSTLLLTSCFSSSSTFFYPILENLTCAKPQTTELKKGKRESKDVGELAEKNISPQYPRVLCKEVQQLNKPPPTSHE